MASMQKLKPPDTTYSASDDADIYLGGINEDVNPGNEFEASVAFDVPVGTQPTTIELHDAPFSNGVEVNF